jgi:hypothetical protein
LRHRIVEITEARALLASGSAVPRVAAAPCVAVAPSSGAPCVVATPCVAAAALLRYVLRPPIAQERVEIRPDGLVRVGLNRVYADGTVAIDWTHSRSSAGSPPACRRRATTS